MESRLVVLSGDNCSECLGWADKAQENLRSAQLSQLSLLEDLTDGQRKGTKGSASGDGSSPA